MGIGPNIKSSQFVKGVLKNVRPAEKHAALKTLKAQGLSATSLGHISLSKAKQVTEGLQHGGYLRNVIGTEKHVSSYQATPKHALEAIMEPARDLAAERRAAEREEFKSTTKERRDRVIADRTERREQKEIARREKIKESNLARVRAERAREQLEEVNLPGKESSAPQPSKVAAQPLPIKPPAVIGNADEAVDMMGDNE